MTDAQIIAALAAESPLPSVYRIIRNFQCGYQQALRCWKAAGGGVRKKVYTMEDF